jgi:KRAB domain-containing zinc finger protein
MDEKKEFKYNCEKCDYHCNAESSWEIHINTTKHKTGKKKQRCDYKEPYKCPECDYKTKNKTTLSQHKLNEHASKEEREKNFKYYCNMCDFGTFSIDSFEIHKESNKHKKRIKNYN